MLVTNLTFRYERSFWKLNCTSIATPNQKIKNQLTWIFWPMLCRIVARFHPGAQILVRNCRSRRPCACTFPCSFPASFHWGRGLAHTISWAGRPDLWVVNVYMNNITKIYIYMISVPNLYIWYTTKIHPHSKSIRLFFTFF